MHSSIAISLVVHAVVIAAAIFGLPNPTQYEPEKTEAVPVEILTVSDLTRLQAQSKKAKPTEKIAPQKVEEKPEDPSPKPAVEQKKIAAVPVEEPPKPAPEPAPAPKPEAVAPPPPAREEKAKVEEKPEPKPEPKVEPEPEPKKVEEPKVVEKPAPPRPKVKPKPPKKVVEKKKDEEFDLAQIDDSISALIDKSQDKNQSEIKEAIGEDGSPTVGEIESRIGSDVQLTLDEEDALRQQIERCWNPPAGVADAGKLLVQLRIGLNADGSLQSNPTLVNSLNHPSFEIAANSAIRAVLRCAPYDMPAEKYETWRDIKMNFDPSKMFN